MRVSYNRRKEQRKRARAFVDQYKMAHNCVFCGELDVKELTFHHPVPSDIPQIQRMIQQGYSQAGLKSKLDQLVVVCGGCHRLMEGPARKG